MAIDHEALLKTFLNEAEEGFALMETGLMTLEEIPDDRESLTAIFRIAHSFKGNAGIFGFMALADLAHALEDVLDEMREGEIVASRDLVTLLLQTVDLLREMVERSVAGDLDMRPPEHRMLENLRQIAAGGGVAAPPTAETQPSQEPSPETSESAEAAAETSVEDLPLPRTAALDDEAPKGAAQPAEAATAPLPTSTEPASLATARAAPAEEIVQESEVRPPETRPPETKSAPERPRRQPKTLRVDLDKLDRLLNLAGEIGIARGRLTQMLEDPEISRDELLEIQRESDFLQLELQELVMKVRMVPVGPTFRYYARVVRDLAQANNKEARIAIEGEDVEVDAAVIESLRDPLTHMIRNAIDHGIEPPEVRRQRGKDPCGQMRLRAFHAAGTILIELIDDGAGLDRRRILERARSLGLVSSGETPSDREIHQLIFEPGFSTANTVTDLSGRGVGMDVVRRNIESMRGTVSVHSQPGQGTTLSIRLPLTLAIIEGFMVGVGEEVYIIPLDAVTETTALGAGAFHDTDRGVLDLRGTPLPYVRLRDALGMTGGFPARESVVVVRSDSGAAGLVVDTLYGETQTVIKPLSRLFRQVRSISGSSILGNGRVALILDVPDLLRRELEREAHLAARSDWRRHVPLGLDGLSESVNPVE